MLLSRLLLPTARSLARPTSGGLVAVPVALRPRGGSGGWASSAAVRAPRSFDLIGARWRRGHPAEVQVRVKRHGRWSRWLTLPNAADHGPDHGRTPPGTDPAWIGGARTFQLRVRGPVAMLNAHLVPSGRRGLRALAANAARTSSGSPPAIITREQWGAAKPKVAPSYGDVQLAFVHHTVSLNDYSRDESAAMVRGIQRYHQQSNGWNDIGYNFLVDRYGQVFEGRGGGIDQPVIGAQAQGYNYASTGVASLGTHTSVPATSADFESIAAVIAWKLSIHGRPTEGAITIISEGGSDNRYPSGRRVRLERISGHRDGDSTSCPGDALYAQLAALRKRATELAFSNGLSIALARSRADYLKTTTVSGRLVPSDGSSPASVLLDVQAHTPTGWTTLTSVTTAGDGSWSTQVALPYTRSLRAIAPATATRGLLRSPSVRLEVRPKLTVLVKPRRVPRGRHAVVRGRIKPAKRRQKVTVAVDRRKTGGGYRRVLRLRVTARSGHFSLRLPLLRRSLLRITVTTPKDRLSAPGKAARLYTRVRG